MSLDTDLQMGQSSRLEGWCWKALQSLTFLSICLSVFKSWHSWEFACQSSKQLDSHIKAFQMRKTISSRRSDFRVQDFICDFFACSFRVFLRVCHQRSSAEVEHQECRGWTSGVLRFAQKSPNSCDGLNFQQHVPKFLFVKNKRMLSQQNQNCSKYILLVPDVGRWLSARWSRQGYVPMDAVDFSLHIFWYAQQLVAAIVCK